MIFTLLSYLSVLVLSVLHISIYSTKNKPLHCSNYIDFPEQWNVCSLDKTLEVHYPLTLVKFWIMIRYGGLQDCFKAWACGSIKHNTAQVKDKHVNQIFHTDCLFESILYSDIKRFYCTQMTCFFWICACRPHLFHPVPKVQYFDYLNIFQIQNIFFINCVHSTINRNIFAAACKKSLQLPRKYYRIFR
jgi:hypothetical protein